MKKLFYILLAGLLLSCTVSCGNAEPTVTDASAADAVSSATETTAETVRGYVCMFDNGTSIEMGAPAADIVAGLGDPMNVAEAPSCIHEGTDRVYTFSGYTLTTSPDADGNDRIYEIALLSDAVMLEGGVSVGSPMEDAVKVFGENYTEQFGVLQYELENVKVSIVLDGDSYITSLVITAN